LSLLQKFFVAVQNKTHTSFAHCMRSDTITVALAGAY